MKLIQQLIRLKNAISERKTRPVDEKILMLLDKAPDLTDQEAARYFYPDAVYARGNLNRLKLRTTSYLINHINATKVESPKPLKILSELSKTAYVLRMMAAKGIREGFEDFGEKSFKKAKRNHLTDIALSICKELVMHYSIIKVDPAKFNFYKTQYQTLLATKQAEVQAELYLFEVFNHLNLHKNISEKYREKIGTYINELKKDYPDSYWYGYLKYNLKVIYLEALGNKDDLLRICQSALNYFESLEFDPPPYVFRTFTFRTVPLLILAREFNATKIAIAKIKNESEAGTHNWMAMLQYECILGFHSKEYSLCLEAINESKKYKSSQRESWLIYEAYLYLFSHLGKYDNKRFRLGKFLNEVPKYSKDKKGMNINILIIQILVLLKDRRWPAIVDRIDALKAYTYRHLKTESTQRSDIFLSMLAVLPKVAFQRSEAKTRTASALSELQQSPILSVDFEVVPYEDLWDLVLELLI